MNLQEQQMNKKKARKEHNKAIEEARREAAREKRQKKQIKALRIQGISEELQAKIDAEKQRQDQLKIEEESRLNALPPKEFFFTVVTEIPGRVWAREAAMLYGLSDEEKDEALKLIFIDKMNSRPIRACRVVEWGDYKED